MSRSFLGALRRRDLAGIRRALFLEPLLQRNTGELEALRPEDRDGVPGGQEERPAAEIELPPAELPSQVAKGEEQESASS